MSKGKYIFLAIILLVALPLGGFYLVEKNVEKNIAAILKQQNITAKSITYSLIKNSLEIIDLQGTVPLFDQGSYSIGRIEALGVNTEAFNPQLEDPKNTHPLVADTVIYSDFHMEYATGTQKGRISADSLRILGWRQHLGKISISAPTTEYIQSIMDIYAAEIHSSGLQSFTLIDGKKTEQSVESNIIKDIQPTSIGSYVSHGIAMRTELGKGHAVRTHVDTLEVGHTDLPSPAFMEFLLKQAEAAAKNTQSNAVMSDWQKYLQEYFATGLNPEFKAQNIRASLELKDQTLPITTVKNVHLYTHYNATKADHVAFGLQIQDAQYNLDTIISDKRLQQIIKNMLGTAEVTLNTKLEGDLAHKEKVSTIVAKCSVDNLANLQLDAGFILPLESFSPLFQLQTQGPELQNIITSLQITALGLKYQDKGLIPRTLISVSKQTTTTLEDAYPITLNAINKELSSLKHVLNENNAMALDLCLEAPGDLEIALELPSPIPLLALGMAATVNPKRLPLKVQCKQGLPMIDAARKILEQ